jgi:hypothetical protein
MDTDPTSHGWTIHNNGGSHSLSEGILTITAPAYYYFDAPTALWDDTVNNTLGWSVEARVRLTSFGLSSPNVGGARIWAHDHAWLSVLDIYPDRIEISMAFSGVHYMDTMDGYHTYRLEGQGTGLSVSVDGMEVLDLVAGKSGGTHTLMFGDGTNSNPTTSKWDYFTFTTIPAPAALTILAVGGALAGSRRRRS